VVYRQKISDNLEVATIYAYAGALAPQGDSTVRLPDRLQTTLRHSLSARISGHVPSSHTKYYATKK
jgi:hypothetical protein